MNQEKDYSLLRPFDLEEAEKGNPICWKISGEIVEYVSGPDICGSVCVSMNNYLYLTQYSGLRMAPLCWVEGKPLYKGGTVYSDCGQGPFKIVGVTGNGTVLTTKESGWAVYIDAATWVAPKVKREGWMNLYPDSSIHATKEIADHAAGNNRKACVKVEWKE